MDSKADSRLLHSKFLSFHVDHIDILTQFSVGAHFIYASWYKKSELGTRAAIFVCFGHLGSMAGGWIQAGLLESLAGRNGLPAWRWIFIIVSVITIPTAIFGKYNQEVHVSLLIECCRMVLYSRPPVAPECMVSHGRGERTCCNQIRSA